MLITLLSISPVFFVARFSVTLYIVLGLVAGSLWLTHTVFHGIRYAINPENQTLLVKIGFFKHGTYDIMEIKSCLLYTSPSPRDRTRSRMPSSA